MDTCEVTTLFSPTYQELRRYISAIRAPYTLQDIQGFNAIYKRAYSTLSREEKRRIEAFVDTMIEQVAQKEWAAKIFGVV